MLRFQIKIRRLGAGLDERAGCRFMPGVWGDSVSSRARSHGVECSPMMRPMRILTVTVLPMLLAGCPVTPNTPHSPTTPAPQGPGPGPGPGTPSASGTPEDPFHEGVTDTRQPVSPRPHGPAAPPVEHRPPPVEHRPPPVVHRPPPVVHRPPPVVHRPPPVVHRPPPVVHRPPSVRRPPVAHRPTVAPTVIGDAVDKAIAALAGASSLQRKRTLILQLGQTRDPRSVDALVRHLNSRQLVDVRASAAQALGRLGASWSLRSLSSLLSARSTNLRSAARKALAKVCRAPGGGTKHYLRIVTPRDTLPKRMLAARSLLLSLAKSYATCSDCVLRWPGCPKTGSGGGRQLTGYEVQPQIKVTKSAGSTSLSVSVLILTHPKGSLKGTLSAQATFDVELSRPFVKYVLQSLSDSLKGSIDRFVRQLRGQASGR